MADNEMTVSFPGGKRVTAHYDGFDILTDQSLKYGGDASAPEPYDLFLASLATCAGIYVLGFCAKRDIPTEGIRLVQRWKRDDKGRLARLEIDIELPAGFPEQYQDAVVRSANQCAVKKTMESPPEMVVRTITRD
jgi:putative redox protein